MKNIIKGCFIIVMNLMISCEDFVYSGVNDFVYKNESSYDIEYYIEEFYEVGKDSLFFSLSPNSEFKISVNAVGDEDGGAVQNCCINAPVNIQSFRSVKLKSLKEGIEKCIIYNYGEGPSAGSNFDIVKKGFNHFELTYTFTDSILQSGTVCE